MWFLLIATSLLHFTKSCNNIFDELGGKFSSGSMISRPNIIKPCEGMDFCEHPVFYPEDQMLKVLSRPDGSLWRMLFEPLELVWENKRHRSMHPAEVAALQPVPEKLCPTNSSWIIPRLAKNWKGDWKYIINRPKNHEEYTQFVYVTTCTRAGACDPYGDILNSHVNSECSQEYMNIKLVALGVDGSKAEIDTFRFPSCCSCMITKNLEF
ncbi:uncharacterized protein LOC111699085 [Eurytemora carolleeae]|uniref:uncharacterized protein LOC111699085 n=1 Tax=Eurytemora carolleeae TaxID=1294199 RepID=UPI000C76DBFA|nr:uncharacterized protein LOC111699085 [Eurytemora carolleeae]|eukprot:XP_023325417.1 uncharacterized protein LOC111699085 [Eurytemora affinis]